VEVAGILGLCFEKSRRMMTKIKKVLDDPAVFITVIRLEVISYCKIRY
jgi:hypothetical protein